ncbi:MAG: GNAT family N-acetyltransferase [bacterium]
MMVNQISWIVRPAIESDAKGITECVRLAYLHYVDRIGKPPGPMTENYKEVIQTQEVHVAESLPGGHGQVIGVLVLIPSAERFLLDNVAVLPQAQGAGVGSALIELAEQRAAELGYDRIQLYTHECMTENLQMYPRLGYLECNRVVEKGYPRVYFEKIIDPGKFARLK